MIPNVLMLQNDYRKRTCQYQLYQNNLYLELFCSMSMCLIVLMEFNLESCHQAHNVPYV